MIAVAVTAASRVIGFVTPVPRAVWIGREVLRVRAEQDVEAHRFDLFGEPGRVAGRGFHDDTEFCF
jgi:hypothetical protein